MSCRLMRLRVHLGLVAIILAAISLPGGSVAAAQFNVLSEPSWAYRVVRHEVSGELEAAGFRHSIWHLDIDATARQFAADVSLRLRELRREYLTQAGRGVISLSWWEDGRLLMLRVRGDGVDADAARSTALLVRSAALAGSSRERSVASGFSSVGAAPGQNVRDSGGGQHHRLETGTLTMPIADAISRLQSRWRQQGFVEWSIGRVRNAEAALMIFERRDQLTLVVVRASANRSDYLVQVLGRGPSDRLDSRLNTTGMR